MKTVYFDNAATTQMRPEVIEAMVNAMQTTYGNPSSTHSFGRSAKALMESCRKEIAAHFKVSASEIVFTSGGTEANNLILNSAVRDLKVTHIITSRIEHHAVLHTVEHLERQFNIKVSYVNVDKNGVVDMKHLETLLQTPNKTLVSLMHINNEIGNILPLKEVAVLCKQYEALFHSDTVQSVGHMHLVLSDIPVDFVVASAHKFHGPKGIGFAFIRKNTGLKPLIFGGEQERGFRAGTESVHNIIGMATALKLSYQHLEAEQNQIVQLKTRFIELLKDQLLGVEFNGLSETAEATYTILNVRLPLSPDKAVMLPFQMDLKGIACSRGSACQSGSAQNSHVLEQILEGTELLKPSVRFSFSHYNTIEEVEYVALILRDL